jgi:hypothetical protein
MTPLKILLSVFVTTCAVLLAGTAQAVALPDAAAVPGGVALIELPAGSDITEARFNERPVLLASNGETTTAVIGLALGT